MELLGITPPIVEEYRQLKLKENAIKLAKKELWNQMTKTERRYIYDDHLQEKLDERDQILAWQTGYEDTYKEVTPLSLCDKTHDL
ncbi:MAG: hypothetical protein FWE31_01565 [Firmicutes bacterium]|nr:hypothetical protein [Bacillota bacterium]